MTPKIDIDLSNIITAKDQIYLGMHLWSVGSGGTAAFRGPSATSSVRVKSELHPH